MNIVTTYPARIRRQIAQTTPDALVLDALHTDPVQFVRAAVARRACSRVLAAMARVETSEAVLAIIWDRGNSRHREIIVNREAQTDTWEY